MENKVIKTIIGAIALHLHHLHHHSKISSKTGAHSTKIAIILTSKRLRSTAEFNSKEELF